MSEVWKPLKQLNSKQIEAVQKQYPIFKRVQAATCVPWYMIASVWMRETGQVVFSGNNGGPFQFDPPPSAEKQRKWYDEYSSLPKAEVERYIKLGVKDFEAAAFLCGVFLQWKVGGELNMDASDELVKEAFWRYNGAAYGSADKSPYVMSYYDQAHSNLRIVGTIEGKPVNKPDANPGAFVTYKQLRLLFPMRSPEQPTIIKDLMNKMGEHVKGMSDTYSQLKSELEK